MKPTDDIIKIVAAIMAELAELQEKAENHSNPAAQDAIAQVAAATGSSYEQVAAIVAKATETYPPIAQKKSRGFGHATTY